MLTIATEYLFFNLLYLIEMWLSFKPNFFS
jgi:hypothetical protein